MTRNSSLSPILSMNHVDKADLAIYSQSAVEDKLKLVYSAF